MKASRMTGNALRRAQAFLGFTQDEMAAAMGVSIATYQRRVALAEEYIPLAEGTHVWCLTKWRTLETIDAVPTTEDTTHAD